MRKIYNSRAFWAITSLLMSLAIWIYVTSIQSDEYTNVFHNVRLEVVGEDTLKNNKNMVITELDTNTVTIEVTGPRRIVGSWDSSDLVAKLDVSKLSRSSYTSQQYYISYPDGVDSSDITVNRKSPETISFMVSPLNTKTVQVRGSFDGSLAEGFTAEAPIFEPSVITVSGPDSYLKDISYAWVTFGQENVSSTFKADSGFVLMNEQGEECSTTYLTLSDEVVTATLPLMLVKEIPLVVDLIEGSGATSANTKVTIEPSSLTLAGDSAILAGMNKIILATIDLTDFASTHTETYTIPLDNQLKNLTGVAEAVVTVEIVGLATETYRVKNISCTNVTDGYTAEIISKGINVVMRGTEEKLAQLQAEQIRAVADLTDYNESAGQFMPEVKIFVDGITDIGAIGNNTISVEIRKA